MTRAALLALCLALAAPAAAVTRDEVVDLARDYCYHEWDCTAANLSVDCSNSWSSDYSVGTYIGLPYDWGGYYTLPEYDAALADGEGAGSHSWHGILSCTAGVDCSGFVSQIWQTGHYSTSTLYQCSYEVSSSDLTRGDAVNDPGSHVVLFAHETDAGRPVFYEASGSASKVRLNSGNSWSYLSGYTPARYDNITDGVAAGTVSNPIVISSFPYESFDATAGVGSDQLDSYACAPDTDESGPERVYRVDVGQSGTLSATVTDDADTDVDIHLLSSTDPDSCVVRDDVSFSWSVSPGSWYLTADTWCSGGGTEYPGGYFLHVDFSAGGGDDDDDTGDDDTGDDDTGDDDDTADDDTAGDDDSGPPPPPGSPEPHVSGTYGEGDGCSCLGPGPGRREPIGAAILILAPLSLTLRRRR